MKFEAGKRYKTRSGDIAVIDEVCATKIWCLVGRLKGKSKVWNKAGRYDSQGYDHLWDLLEEISAEA